MILQYIIRFLSRVSLHRMQPWKLTTAEEPHSEEILTLVCEEFCSNSTLHKALGIGTEEYREAMTDGWHDYLFSGPVAPLLATGTDNNKILACIIPAPFPSDFKDFQTLPEIQQAIPALLAELETRYLQKYKPPEKSLLVDIAVVAADAANTGIYQQLRLALERNAADAGFEKIFGELSSAATQRVCVEKFKHKLVAEIPYQKFTYKNRKPFASISSPESIQLVEQSLIHLT